jgi:hypothetical protein
VTAALLVPVTCGHCAGHVRHVTSSRATSSEASAVVACEACRTEFQVHVRLLVVPNERREAASRRRAEVRARQRQAVGA